MTLLSLKLERFRLVERAEIELAPGINLFHGENAQGKTTLLEAAGMLSTGRSFRTTKDRECIKWEEQGAGVSGQGSVKSKGRGPRDEGREAEEQESAEFAAVEGAFAIGPTRHMVRIAIEPSRKSVFRDGKPLKTLSQLWGVFRTIFFVPSDLALVQGPPLPRRNDLDTLLAQSQPSLLRTLAALNKSMASRTSLIKRRMPANDAQYDAFEKTLAAAAARIALARARLVARLSEGASTAMAEIADGHEQLALRYAPGFGAASGIGAMILAGTPADELAAELRTLWRKSRAGDIERGMTREGPHRDDVRFEIDGRDARCFASQGQTRCCVLALRLAELDLLSSIEGAMAPVLLLDDVLGELDAERARRFLERVAARQVQTLMTATGTALALSSLPVERRFHVSEGQVERDR